MLILRHGNKKNQFYFVQQHKLIKDFPKKKQKNWQKNRVALVREKKGDFFFFLNNKCVASFLVNLTFFLLLLVFATWIIGLKLVSLCLLCIMNWFKGLWWHICRVGISILLRAMMKSQRKQVKLMNGETADSGL